MTVSDQKAVIERLSQTAAAHLCGVSPRTLREWDCPRHSDGTYSGAALMEWRIDAVERDGAVACATGEAAERFRMARARLAELQLAREEKRLIPVEDIDALLSRLVAVYRSTGEQVQRKYGPDSLGLFEKGRDQLVREIDNARIVGDGKD